MKLVCVYHHRTDKEYQEFEQKVLMRHNRLFEYVKGDKEKSIFVFDFSDKQDDWQKFLEGQYSKLSKDGVSFAKERTWEKIALQYVSTIKN